MPVTSTTNELPGSLNLTIYQGATFSVTLTWTTDGSPVNLTGYTADMMVKNGQTDVVELSTTNGRIALGGSAGTITLTIDADDTAALTPVHADYDLLLTSGTGVVVPLLAGLVTVRESVTG